MKNVFLLFVLFVFVCCNRECKEVKYTYSNGNIKEVLFYKKCNQKKDYVRIIYYKNGKMKIKSIFENGIKNGIQQSWFENGKIESQGFFINGKRDGVWFYWKINNNLIVRTYQVGILSGRCYEMLKDKRTVSGQYINGKEFGKWIWRDSLGNVQEISHYEHGLYNGVSMGFYDNGIKRGQVNYKNGKKNGVMTLWNEKGIEIKKEEYCNGNLIK